MLMMLILLFILAVILGILLTPMSDSEKVVRNVENSAPWSKAKAVLASKAELPTNPPTYEFTLSYQFTEYTFIVPYAVYRKYPPLRMIPIMVRPDGNKYEVKIQEDI